MTTGLYKKGLVLAIICLFIGASLVPSISGNVEKNDGNSTSTLNLDDGLVGYWSFDEGSGNVAHDSVGSNNGEIYGASWTSDSVSGNALSFDGDRDYVTVPHSPDLNFADADSFTLSAWVKRDDIPQGRSAGILTKRRGEGGYKLMLDADYTIAFGFGISPVGYDLCSASSVDTNWHHIMAIWDGSSQYIYIDGKLENSAQYDNANIGETTSSLEIGSFWFENCFYGAIDEIKIYNEAVFPEVTPIVKINGPTEEEIVRGNVTIHGESTIASGTIKRVEIKIGDTGEWNDATGTDVWVYPFDFSGFDTGPLTIYARSYSDMGKTDETSVTVHVDNFNELPSVTINSPLDGDIVYGTVQIQGDFNDNDGFVQHVYVKIGNNNWEEAYMQNDWLYILNTVDLPDTSCLIYVKCIDNDSYWSPVEEITIFVDNNIPEIEFIAPQEGYLYVLYEILKFRYYIQSSTFVFGELNAIVEISSIEYVHKDQVKFYVGNEEPYRGNQVGSTNRFQCDAWNRKNSGDFTLKVEVINDNRHNATTQIDFKYFHR